MRCHPFTFPLFLQTWIGALVMQHLCLLGTLTAACTAGWLANCGREPPSLISDLVLLCAFNYASCWQNDYCMCCLFFFFSPNYCVFILFKPWPLNYLSLFGMADNIYMSWTSNDSVYNVMYRKQRHHLPHKTNSGKDLRFILTTITSLSTCRRHLGKAGKNQPSQKNSFHYLAMLLTVM